MNVTTIGFPFGAAPDAPAFGTPGQDFALALGAATGPGLPMLPGKAAVNDTVAPPANDAGPLMPGANPLARTQPGASLSLTQLLATGSKVTALSVEAAHPLSANAVAPEVELPAASPGPDTAIAAAPPSPTPIADENGMIPDGPVKGTGASVPSGEASASVPATTIKVDSDTEVAIACPTGGEAPMPLELPTAGRPAAGPVATAPVATPPKTRKPIATNADEPRLPADPLVAQPTAAPVAVPTTPIAPAAQTMVPERKPDGGRGKATAIASVQAELPVPGDTAAPTDATTGKEPSMTPKDASFAEAAVPTEAAVKTETRPASAPLSQNFAAHVAQSSAAQAPAHSAAPAPASASTDPTVPARAGQLGHALGVEIARKVEAGEDTLRVRLNPIELGRIEVTLAFDDSGNLRATMRAESRHALDLLRQDAPDLGRALDSAGVRADAQSFRFESRSDGNGGAGGQSGHQHSRGNSQHAFNDEPETLVPAYRAIRSDSQVDLLA